MANDENQRGVVAWVKRWWRALLAEVMSTALLVLLGLATLMGKTAPPLTHPALAFGFIIVANAEAFGAASGAHMNPAVTLAAVLDRRLPPLAGLAYVVAQLLGATLGFALLVALVPALDTHDAVQDSTSSAAVGAVAGAMQGGNSSAAVGTEASKVRGGTSSVAVGAVAGAVLEALLTGTLVLLLCGLWAAEDAGARDPVAPIKVGLTVAGLIYVGGDMTGASLNPARSFAPALLQKFESDHWVYWVGPLGGAALATLLHRYALRPPRPPTRKPEELPLRDKAEP